MQFYHILTFAHKTSVTSIFIQYFIIIMSAGYATSLIEALRESYMDSPKALQEVRQILPTNSQGGGRQPLSSPAVTLQKIELEYFFSQTGPII